MLSPEAERVDTVMHAVFMRADIHGARWLVRSLWKEPRVLCLKTMLVLVQEGLTGNGKHLCWGEQPGSALAGRGRFTTVRRGRERQEGGIKPAGKATASSPFATEKWRSEEISYSNVLTVAP